MSRSAGSCEGCTHVAPHAIDALSNEGWSRQQQRSSALYYAAERFSTLSACDSTSRLPSACNCCCMVCGSCSHAALREAGAMLTTAHHTLHVLIGLTAQLTRQ